LLRFRHILLSSSLLVATLLVAPATTSFAHPLSGDPSIDKVLVTPHFHALWPTEGSITTYFGEVGPLSPRGHTGLDIAAPEGTPIVAADEGEVLKAYWSDDGYGGLIIIGHPSGYETWYAHLDGFDVSKGSHVARGQQIAEMGSTGYSTGPHLHFEVREDGQMVDPLGFLSEANLKPATW
jgi:lipoprotein NlpD